jgi:dCTP deaminase
MLLSNRDITLESVGGNIVIQPFYPELMQPSSYDVTLGSEFKLQMRACNNEVMPDLDPRQDSAEYFSDISVPRGSAFALEPGSFALASTYEVIALGPNIAARCEGKSSLGRIGLQVHATAGFIDPGFDGTVTLELTNVGSMTILLWPGMKIGQLCFFKLSSPATILYGSRATGSHYQNQAGPTTSRGFENFRIYDVYPPETQDSINN